jgi:hypothetical protein
MFRTRQLSWKNIQVELTRFYNEMILVKKSLMKNGKTMKESERKFVASFYLAF